MSKDRFIYKRRHLREWLLQLVEKSHKRRWQACKAIMACYAGPKDLPLLQWEDWTLAFEAEIKAALQGPDFPRAEFVRKVLSLSLEQQTIIDRKQEQDRRWHTKHRLGKNHSAEQYLQYVAKSIARLEREEKTVAAKEVEAAKDTVVCVKYLMMGLGTELLPAGKELRQMLKHPSLDEDACQAIKRMGKAGLVFFPDLMKGLRQPDSDCPHAEVLGLQLREKPKEIRRCFELTQGRNKALRCHAAITLGFCGREALKQFPRIETKARGHLKDARDDESIGWWPVLRTSGDYEWHAWAWLLGETAVTRATVSEFLKVTKSGNNHRTAKAIECLGRIKVDAKRVVPRLAELMDEFEEFYQNTPPQLRVTMALESFGPKAKPAIPALIKHLWMKKDYGMAVKLGLGAVPRRKAPDYIVIQLLGKLGRAAKEALPALRRMKAELGPKRVRAELVEAIKRIEGSRKDGKGLLSPSPLLRRRRRG